MKTKEELEKLENISEELSELIDLSYKNSENKTEEELQKSISLIKFNFDNLVQEYANFTEKTFSKIEKNKQPDKIKEYEKIHRNKNLIQIINSMFRIKTYEKTNKEQILIAKGYLNAMSAINQFLDKQENQTSIKKYFENLYFNSSKLIKETNINIQENFNGTQIDSKRIHYLGLITIELFFNTLKYAFPEEQKNKIINVSAKKDKKNIIFTYENNGRTFEEEVDKSNSTNSGFSTINNLLKKDNLNGKITYKSLEPRGVRFDITIYNN